MRNFAALFQQIDQTQSTNEKVAHMKDYFATADSGDSSWALFFLSGHRLKRFISSSMLFSWCLEYTKMPEWLMSDSYEAVGDTAETISLLLPRREKSLLADELTLSDWLENKLLPLRNASDQEKKKQIFSFWDILSTQEIFILNKILTGSFRVGVSSLLTLKGLSQALNVSRETLSHRVMGNWEPTPDFFESLKLTDIAHAYMNPYPFYLAYPLEGGLENLGDASKWQAEWKWDGIRAQGIHRNGEEALWSRGNELVSHQFPEIIEALKTLPEGTVLDGEILAYKEGKPLAFGELQKRLGRKQVSKAMMEQVPIVFMIYDILEEDGKDIRSLPMQERRKKIEAFLFQSPKFILSPVVQFKDWDELMQLRTTARDLATEGIMLKKNDSSYGVGRHKGNWWKFKVDPMSIDAVLIYAQAGSGKRANLYTDYTFGVWHENELIPIAKAYSGLDLKEINELDRWIRRNTEEKFGPVRKVKAHHLFEIAFEGIQKSNRHKSGVALRFPRIARWRKDKPYEEADTLENIKKTFLNENI